MSAAERLARLDAQLSGPRTLGDLSQALGSEGAGLLVILLAAPFLQPFPTAGLCVPAGLMLAAAGWGLLRGAPSLRLPPAAANRRLDEATLRKILRAAGRALALLERWTRSRGPDWARSPRTLGAGVAVMGLALAVPVYVPFGATACALPLAMFGLALVEDDGAAGLAGWLGAAACLAYHAAFARLIWAGLLALRARLA